MAQTIGSAFGETFGVGQRIGDAWSERRFNAKAQAIRTEFEALAAQEGKNLEDYLPQMETALRDAAASSQRRGLSLEQPTLDRWNADIGRAGERRAGALALQGNQAGARDTRAANQYAMGNFDAGQGQQIAGDTVRATSGAVMRDPSTGQQAYNPAAGASALSQVGARYGDAATAQGQQQNAGSFRMQAAQGLAGQLFNLFQSPEIANPDQVAGLFEGLKQYVPELGNTELRVDPQSGQWLVYSNGSKTATGAFDPKDRQDMDEFSTMLTSFSRQPIESLNTYTQTRIANIADQKKSDSQFAGKIDDAMIKVITDAKAQQIPDAVAQKLVNAGTGSGDSKGWQLQEMGDQPGSYLMQKGGNVYRVETNVAPNLEAGERGGKVQVFDLNDKPVDPSVLNKADRDGFEYNLSLITDMANLGNSTQLEWMRGQLGALNSLRNQRFGTGGGAPSAGTGGGGGARSERNNNPGNIEDRGQFKGNPDYLGSDGRFARFRTPEAGQAAQRVQLERYMEGKTTGAPLTTVQEIVGTWSPQTDPTNQAGSTANYVSYVARRLGVDPTAPLTKADIPRLQQAMAEFEGGNAQTGAIATRQPPAGNVVAGASDQRMPAAQAPMERRPASRQALTREGVLATKGRLDEARDQFATARSRLQEFERDFLGGQPGQQRVGREFIDRSTQLSPAQQRAYQRLQADAAQAQTQLQALTGETRRGAQALTQQTRQSREDAEAEELYSRYGGAADFFRAAQ